MHPVERNNWFLKQAQNFIFHALFISTTILLLFIVTLPISLKSNLLFNSDLAFHAREIWELMQGRDLFYYYEEVSYHGILEGLAAIPFLKFIGVFPTSYSFPAIIFYGLFIWTTFLILRISNLTAGWITSILLLFPPLWISEFVITQNNLCALILFLGNLTFLYLIKLRTEHKTAYKTIFLLWIFSGLAIYAYTYSIIYIFTVALILTLTHPLWVRARPLLTVKNLVQSFKNLHTIPQYLFRIIDIIIALFIIAILYSYIFGGFGLDIEGVTLLQINNLHKPLIQVTVLILIRLTTLIIQSNVEQKATTIREKFIIIIAFFKSYYRKITPTSKRLIIIGATGFILGMLPRLYSVLNGSITRGGQGFDTDLSPIRIILHSFKLITVHLTEIMGLSKPLSCLIKNPAIVFFEPQAMLVLPMMGLAFFATYSFIKPNWGLIKKIVRLESLTFNPNLILLIFPATLCASTVIMQNGPHANYLYPLYWTITIYVGFYLSKVSNYSRALIIIIIGIWVVFYTPNTKDYSRELPKWREVFSPNTESPILHIVNFLQSIDVKAVYSSYGMASEIIMYSNGAIQAAQYNKSARGKSLQKKLKNQPDFALVTRGVDLPLILSHLEDHEISYKIKFVYSLSYEDEVTNTYWTIWDFKGNISAINRLRYIFD